MRTPSSALPAWPNGFFEGAGSADFAALPFFAAFFAGSFTTFAGERLAAGFFAAAAFARDLAGFAALAGLAGLRAFDFAFFAIFLSVSRSCPQKRASRTSLLGDSGPRPRGDER